MRRRNLREPSIEPLESRRLLSATALADLSLTEGPAYTVPDATSAVMGGAVYMAVTRGVNNTELWRSDGTPGGATLVKSITAFQSAGASAPPPLANFTVVGDTLFFTASQSELWKSDGTAAGTVPVSWSVNTARSGLYAPEFVSVGGRLYFTTYNSSTFVTELWTSDGTDAGTRKITVPGTSSNGIGQLVADGNTLYFVSGGVFKLTAGSAAPVMVAANVPTSGRSMVVMDGVLYFFAFDAGASVYKLFRYAGTGAPTAWGSFSNPTVSPAMTVMGGRLYFGAAASGDQTRQELWQSDGTPAGTRLVKDINPTTDSRPSLLTASGNLLYFTASDGTHGTELWRTDGTEAGTFLLSDVEPGTASGSPAGLTDVGGRLFFSARTAAGGTELWRTDGTEETTVRVADLYAGPGSSSPHELMAVGGDALYFQGVDSRTGYGLFTVGRDGDAVTSLYDYFAGPMNGKIDRAVMADGRLVFAAGDGTSTGRELYLSDGTPAGTGLVKNINTTAWNGSFPTGLTRVGDAVYFSASSSFQVGAELWKTDGTAAGTVLVKDIRPNTSQFSIDPGSTPRSMIDFNGTLYFVADDGTNGRRLYRSDGTGAGTVMVTPTPGVSTLNLGSLFTWDGVLYFSPDVNVLQKYDGTSATPTTVKVLTRPPGAPPSSSSSPRFQGFAVVNGVLWAGGDNGVTGLELWKSDGTPEGTALVKEINPNTDATRGPTSSLPFNFAGLGGYVYFSATELAHGRELWRTDGTAAGTTLFADIVPGAGYSNPGNLLRLGDSLLFTTFDDAHGSELWRTDGTPGGTVIVKDINPGAASSSPGDFTVIGGEVYFTAVDDATGARQLWVTDGTTSGTVRVSTLVPEFTAANPMNLTVAGSSLYFTANDGVSGPKLYRLDSDILSPNVVRSTFVPRGPRPEVTLTLTKDLGPAFDPAEFELRDAATGARVDPASVHVGYDPALRRATITLSPTSALPDGNYRLTVPATAVRDSIGRPMAADFTVDFFMLAGDATRDRVVNFDDLLALAKNYNKTGASFAQGDFTGDGLVNFDDLLVLAKNYNKTVPAGGAAAAVAAASIDAQALAAAMGVAAAPTTTSTKTTATPTPTKAGTRATPAGKAPAAAPNPAARPVPPPKPASTIIARSSTAASVVRDGEKSKPVFSSTPVAKSAPAPAKPKLKNR